MPGAPRDQRLPAHLKFWKMPPLRNPVLVVAFEGWNDASEAASTAARLIMSQRDGERFASVEPEEFFVFTETRPHVRVTRRGRRRLEWPSNEFFACLDPSSDPAARDLVVLLGTEPDLRWRAFSNIVLEVTKRCGVQLVVALGALQAEVPHTLPPRVTGSVANASFHPLLDGLDFKASRYEGPTGIVGVLSTRFADAGYPVVNLWGETPYYIQASPNPVVATQILREAARVLHLELDTSLLDEAMQRFDEQVREAVAKDPEAMAYVHDLEQQVRDRDEETAEPQDKARAAGDLPSGAAMVDALEEFLRKRRRPPGSSASAQ